MLIAIIASVALAGCAPKGTFLNTAGREALNDDGKSYTLIYFVGISHDDIRRAVVLDIEGDEYEFKPIVADFDYEILQNVSIPEGLWEAEIFFRTVRLISGYTIAAILSPDGQKTIGYELKPYYTDKIFYDQNILDMDYSVLKDKKIEIHIFIPRDVKVREKK